MTLLKQGTSLTPTLIRPDIYLPHSGDAFVNDIRGQTAARPLESGSEAYVAGRVPLGVSTSHVTSSDHAARSGHADYRDPHTTIPPGFYPWYQNLISVKCWQLSAVPKYNLPHVSLMCKLRICWPCCGNESRTTHKKAVIDRSDTNWTLLIGAQ